MALQGTLRDFALPDIIQLISLSKKTGAVEITSGEGEGTGLLYFNTGRVISAIFHDLSPLDASCAFFMFQSGDFRFIEGEQPTTEARISISNEMVILEGIKRADDWAKVRARIPSTDYVVKLVVDPAGVNREINLKPEEWRVLTMINGRDSIKAIAQKAAISENRAASIVYHLLNSGLVEGVQQAARPTPVPAPAPAPTPTRVTPYTPATPVRPTDNGLLINPLPGTGQLRGETAHIGAAPPNTNGNGSDKGNGTSNGRSTEPLQHQQQPPESSIARQPGAVPLPPPQRPPSNGYAAPPGNGHAAPPTNVYSAPPINIFATGPLQIEHLPQPTPPPPVRPQTQDGPALFTRLEGVAISELGITGRMLLNEAYRRLHVMPGADVTATTAGELCDQFERSAGLLLGAARARSLANMLRHAAAEMFSM